MRILPDGPRMRTRAGMTLMELVVGLVITGMMAAAGTAAFTSIVDHRRSVREASLGTERAAALRSVIREWIVGGTVSPPRGGGPRVSNAAGGARQAGGRAGGSGRGNVAAGGVLPAVTTGDELTLNTTALTPLPSQTTRMRVFVDGDEATPEKGLTIEYQSASAGPLFRTQLDSTIGDMSVEYLDQRTNRWYPSEEAATIRAIAVRVTLLPFENDTLPALLRLPFIFSMADPNDRPQAVRR